jgi:alpha-beta hydrolase superfamily lysophospholipase/protein-S-isoprenylcysteine O-methyltransferase Ste14
VPQLVIAWVLWCLLHSGMIAGPVNKSLRKKLGDHHRLFYNLTALVTLTAVVLYWKSLQTTLLFSWEGILIPLRLGLLAASGYFFFAGAGQYDMKQFLGLRGSAGGTTLTGDGTISRSGILGRTRHPWYLGALLFIWAVSRDIDTAALVTNLILTAYLLIGTLLEERKLAAEFGEQYRRYQQEVPMLIPLPLTGRWRQIRRVLGVALAAAFLGVNLAAFLHAGAMTRFEENGVRTPPPESLSILQAARTLLTGVSLPRPEGIATPADLGLTFATHSFAGSSGHRLEAWHIPGPGKGRALILLFHGYAACKADLLPTAARLHALGCDVVLVDFYGSGGSTGSGTTIGYRESGDAAAACRFARERWPESPVVLYGLSMGGAAVLRAVAAEGAAPQAVVVESCFDTLLNTVRSRFRAMHLPPSPLAELLVFWGGVRGGFNAFGHNPVAYASRVSCPALLLCGANDQRISTSESRSLYDALAGPKRYSEYPDAGHQPLATADEGRWREDMAWMLDAAAAAAGRGP